LKGFVLLALMLCVAQPAVAQDTAGVTRKAIKTKRAAPLELRPTLPGALAEPLPSAAVRQVAAPQESRSAAADAAAAAAPPAPSACQPRLAKIAVFEALPVLAGPGECGASDAVLLRSVILSDEAKVTVTPAATMRCAMAEEVARWLRDDVAPAALRLGAPLREIEQADSYECRSRNRMPGAILSEHGRGNALDVRAFTLGNGKTIRLTDVGVGRTWREALRASACARFFTVLGPGSDGNHEEHIHLDLAARRDGYRLCEWEVRTSIARPQTPEPQSDGTLANAEQPVPLPRPRPETSGDGEGRPHAKRARPRSS